MPLPRSVIPYPVFHLQTHALHHTLDFRYTPMFLQIPGLHALLSYLLHPIQQMSIFHLLLLPLYAIMLSDLPDFRPSFLSGPSEVIPLPHTAIPYPVFRLQMYVSHHKFSHTPMFLQIPGLYALLSYLLHPNLQASIFRHLQPLLSVPDLLGLQHFRHQRLLNLPATNHLPTVVNPFPLFHLQIHVLHYIFLCIHRLSEL